MRILQNPYFWLVVAVLVAVFGMFLLYAFVGTMKPIFGITCAMAAYTTWWTYNRYQDLKED